MSNLYIQEPPTNGKVLLETSVGDIDIELWSKETPKACRNFVQLCMEGYYDKTIFHRIVKGFIIQGGDPTGTGMGGESIYGKPFKDEFHQRLRFNRRGLVAMANAGPNDNKSQFFFTLDRADELNKKHTIFGKVGGNTIYNMLRMADVEVEENDRPVDPPKILRAEILSNPFDDIEPRELKKEEEKVKESKKKSKSKGTKNFTLLSFGEEAEEDEVEVSEASKALKIKSSHDVLNDPKLSSETALKPIKKEYEDNSDVQEKIRKKLQKSDEARKRQPSPDSEDEEEDQKKKRRKTLKEEVKKLKRELRDDKNHKKESVDKSSSKEKDTEDQPADNSLIKELKEERKKFLKTKKESQLLRKSGAREDQTLALLAGFQGVLQRNPVASSDEEKETEDVKDDDTGWLSHKFVSHEDVVKAKDANIRDEDTFDIYDPRNPINQRKREKSKQKGKNR